MTLHRYPLMIGAITGWVLHDGDMLMAPARLAKDVTLESPAPALGMPVDAPKDLPASFQPVLLRYGDEWILIDTGVGEDADATHGHVQKHLHALGVERENIRTIILTHAHTDHFGGLTLPGVGAAFPQARIYIQRAEWEWAGSARYHATLDAERLNDLRDNLLAYNSQCVLLDGDVEILPGLRCIRTPGHTPGHMVVIAESGDARLIIAGDACIHPVHVAHPEWMFVNDVLPEHTPAARRRVFALATQSHTRMCAYHFPFPALGRITSVGTAYQWHEEA